MNMVVSTSIAEKDWKWDEYCGKRSLPVRLTVTTASKKNGLKKLVAWPMTFKRTVGRYTVKIVPRSLRPNVIEVHSGSILQSGFRDRILLDVILGQFLRSEVFKKPRV